MVAPAVPQERTNANAKIIGIFLAGAAVAVLLGVYGNEHTPTKEKPYTLFFTDTIHLKVWFATAALVLAVVQVLLAMRLYGKLHWPKQAPAWLGDAHRLVGIVAFGLTLPVAYHCLWALGFESVDMAGEDEHPRARPLHHGVLLLRRVRREGAVRARQGAAGMGAPRGRWSRVHHARRDLHHEQPLVLRRPPRGHPALLRISMGFKRFVNLMEIVVAVVALGFVVMLFANEPDGGGGAADSSPGASIFSASCAGCHGADGGGGVGPKLAGTRRSTTSPTRPTRSPW